MKVKIDFENNFPTLSSINGDFDIYVNGFNGCETIKYGKELSGQTNLLKGLSRLTEDCDKTIISAFDTDNYGIIKQSVGVFEKGKLLGISDMSIALSDNGYMPGSSGKLYQTSTCKIGTAIGDDLFSFDLFKALTTCGAEIIIAITNFRKKEINSIIIRAFSYLLGVPIVLLFKGGCYVSNVNGELTQPTEDCIYDIEPYTDFILKTTKIKLKR